MYSELRICFCIVFDSPKTVFTHLFVLNIRVFKDRVHNNCERTENLRDGMATVKYTKGSSRNFHKHKSKSK